jgi:hypothetical protein
MITRADKKGMVRIVLEKRTYSAARGGVLHFPDSTALSFIKPDI